MRRSAWAAAAAELPVGEDRPPMPRVQRHLEGLDGVGAAERAEGLDRRQVELRKLAARSMCRTR